MFKIKKLIIIILALLVLGGVAVVWSQRKPSATVEPPSAVQGVQEEAVTADLVLDFGDEKIATYSAIRTSEKTVLGLLLVVSSRNNFAVDYIPPSGEVGAFVKSIAGVENTNEKFWQFWVNGKYGQVAMDQQEIKSGDLVEIRFKGFEQ